MADTRFGGAAKANTRRTQGGHKADTRQTQGGHKADTWRAQGGHMAGTRRTHAGQGLEARPKRTQGGHMADKLWERGQSISRPACFFPKREPHSKVFGEKLALPLASDLHELLLP